MRIIAGKWRGRPLQAPTGMATRPTADRVRETLFSMLTSRLGSFEGIRVADLYAGSGALGLEALSRGAAFACFVESDPRALTAIKANVEQLSAASASKIVGRSARQLPPSDPFDLILADPPYEADVGTAVVRDVLAAGWLGSGAWVAIETARGDVVDPATLTLDAVRDVGRARLTLLRHP